MSPRLLRLHPSTYQRLIGLSKEAEADGAYRVAKRLRAVLLNSEGRTSGELAQILLDSFGQSLRVPIARNLMIALVAGVDLNHRPLGYE